MNNPNTPSELMDALETLLVDLIMKTLPEVVKEKAHARNLLGKVGVRIIFGAETYDPIMNKSLKKDT